MKNFNELWDGLPQVSPSFNSTIRCGAVLKDYTPDGYGYPSGWSKNAVSIMRNMYSRGDEASVFATINRLIKGWSKAAVVYGYMAQNSDELKSFEDTMRWILVKQVAAPNSPQWFNTGVPTKDLLWGKSTKSGRIVKEPNRPQVHACFINSVNDDLVGEGGIMDLWKRETSIFKRGSGSGVNVSALREEGAPLSGGGVSSGVMSFLKVGDANAGAIKSGGTTRRAALMRTLDVDHPDIFKFVQWKAKEEQKVKYLVDGAKGKEDDHYSTPMDYSWTGEAYSSVDGQNSNNSVMVYDEFMRAVEEDDDYLLSSRVEGGKDVKIRARDLWDEICKSAWTSADPGLQFWDAINEKNPVVNMERIHATNPCSEYIYLDNTACNLASINLAALLREWEKDLVTDLDLNVWVQKVAGILTFLLDLSVEMAGYPDEEIAWKSYQHRTLGLGFTGLGEFLMMMGLQYESDIAAKYAGSITKMMRDGAIEMSTLLAERIEPAPAWEHSAETASRVFGVQVDKPLRNMQLLAIAPAGTISFVMDAASTGIEPVYSMSVTKTLANGDTMEIACPTLKYIAQHLDEYDDNVVHSDHPFWEKVLNDERITDEDIPEELRGLLATSHTVSPEGHLAMMEEVQRFVCGGISKTINMPHDCTPEDIGEVYMSAYKRGLKAISIYRDGSKLSQPMNAQGDDEPVVETVARQPATRLKLSPKRSGYTKKMYVAGKSIYLRTGEYPDGTLGEIFIDVGGESGVYGALLSAWAKMVSIALQYGAGVDAIYESFEGTVMEPSGLVYDHEVIRTCTSILDLVVKDLEHEYMNKEDESADDAPKSTNKSLDVCTVCGSIDLVVTGTCKTCKKCGATTGC